MLKKIYRELKAIRKELQSIRNAVESVKKVWIGIDMCGEGEKDFSSINIKLTPLKYRASSEDIVDCIRKYRQCRYERTQAESGEDGHGKRQ